MTVAATSSRKRATATRKTRTRKAKATTVKSAPLNNTKPTKIMEEVKAEAPKVDTKVTTKSWIERAKELDGFSLIVLPLIFLEGFTKEILKVAGYPVK